LAFNSLVQENKLQLRGGFKDLLTFASSLVLRKANASGCNNGDSF